jgi:hypothetical protein
MLTFVTQISHITDDIPAVVVESPTYVLRSDTTRQFTILWFEIVVIGILHTWTEYPEGDPTDQAERAVIDSCEEHPTLKVAAAFYCLRV